MCVRCSGKVFFFFKQKTAYEMRISDWSSDVCSSDLPGREGQRQDQVGQHQPGEAVVEPEPPDQLEHAGEHRDLREHGDAQDGQQSRRTAAKGNAADRKSVVSGTSVSVRVCLGGRLIIKNKKNNKRRRDKTHTE